MSSKFYYQPLHNLLFTTIILTRVLIAYSSGGYTNDTWIGKNRLISSFIPVLIFVEWKGNLTGEIFFMPDFDETDGYYDAADGWWYVYNFPCTTEDCFSR
jgi:hypothetical protein